MGLLDAFKQYWQDASPGGVLNPEIPKDTPVLGLLADPMGSIRSTLNKANAQADAHLNKLSAASREMARTKSVRGPAQDAYTNEVGNWMLNTFGPLQTVWHASPYKFDKFDASKIGTGEGAQAYGHGIYTAEARDVAQDGYMHLGRTKAGNVATVGGKDLGDFWNSVQDAANRVPHAKAQPYYDRLAMVEDLMNNQIAPDVVARAKEAGYHPSAIDWFEKQVIPKYEPDAHLYKVDLPDDAIAKMLDWDKPLSQQHPDVQKALSEYGDMVGGVDWQHALKTDDKGSWFYRLLEDVNKNSPRGAASDTANDLRQAGIPGIRYLDGGSRGTGAGTSNFVVFPGNEGLLTILERNGQPLGPGLLKP